MSEPVASGGVRSPTLRRVLGSDCCSGCGLCASLSGGAVEMVVSSDGYLRPSQSAPLEPGTEQLIAEVCPGSRVVQRSKHGEDDTLWGPLIGVSTGHATDERLRHHASSGGALSAVATYLLGSGEVDRVVQTAAALDAPLQNSTVVSREPADIFEAAGSRYSPSAPLAGLLDELEKAGRFALVGKPCDIAAARALALRDPRVDEKVPVMLSFFCAGIPSLKGVRGILKALGVREEDVVRFGFRGDGWPGRATAMLRDGTGASMSYEESWGDILSDHVQLRCKICPDGSGGLADIVFGDAWSLDRGGRPRFDEADGRSLIITRTKTGEALLRGAIANGMLATEPLPSGEIAPMQPSQANRKRLVLSRIAAMALLGKRPPRYAGFNLLRAARAAGIVANVKSFLGMGLRVLRMLGERRTRPRAQANHSSR